MTAMHVTTYSTLSSFLPKLSLSTVSTTFQSAAVFSRRDSLPLLPSLLLSIPAAIHFNVPTLLGDILDSVLRAVPKKKTSYMKKRSRFLAGKALKDVTSLNRCSGCGNIKRSHFLCPYCVNEIKQMFKNKMSPKS